jgi:hypothetical protein
MTVMQACQEVMVVVRLNVGLKNVMWMTVFENVPPFKNVNNIEPSRKFCIFVFDCGNQRNGIRRVKYFMNTDHKTYSVFVVCLQV